MDNVSVLKDTFPTEVLLYKPFFCDVNSSFDFEGEWLLLTALSSSLAPPLINGCCFCMGTGTSSLSAAIICHALPMGTLFIVAQISAERFAVGI